MKHSYVIFIFMILILGLNGITYDLTNICCLPADSGSCNDPVPRYYYNCLGGYCDSFVYNGCEGNSNRFTTLKECKRICNGI